jgi:hypothetical protein
MSTALANDPKKWRDGRTKCILAQKLLPGRSEPKSEAQADNKSEASSEISSASGPQSEYSQVSQSESGGLPRAGLNALAALLQGGGLRHDTVAVKVTLHVSLYPVPPATFFSVVEWQRAHGLLPRCAVFGINASSCNNKICCF